MVGESSWAVVMVGILFHSTATAADDDVDVGWWN